MGDVNGLRTCHGMSLQRSELLRREECFKNVNTSHQFCKIRFDYV